MSGSDDTHILLFDTWTHRLKLDMYNTMHIANVFHAINIPFSNENEIISCALDGKVVIHNVELNQHKIVIQQVRSVHRAAISRQDPKVVYCCCENGELVRYDRRNDRHEPIFNNYNNSLYTLNINPLNGNEIMCGGEEGILTFFDIRRTNIPLFALKHPANRCDYNELKRQRIRYSDSNEMIVINNNNNENENENRSENENGSENESDSDNNVRNNNNPRVAWENNTDSNNSNENDNRVNNSDDNSDENENINTNNVQNDESGVNVNNSENPSGNDDNRNSNNNENNDENGSDEDNSEDDEENEVFEDLSDASVDENLIGNEDIDPETEDNDRLENDYEDITYQNFNSLTEEEEEEDDDDDGGGEGEGEEGDETDFHPFLFSDLFRSNSLTSAKYNFNGTKCVVSYQNGDILLYDLKNQNRNDGISSDYLQLYKGHNNIHTIKEVNFYGANSEYVISGSDTGHIFMWDTFTGEIVTILEADEMGAVNCIQQHPNYIPYIISSGLSNTVSVWTPTLENDADLQHLKDELHLN